MFFLLVSNVVPKITLSANNYGTAQKTDDFLYGGIAKKQDDIIKSVSGKVTKTQKAKYVSDIKVKSPSFTYQAEDVTILKQLGTPETKTVFTSDKALKTTKVTPSFQKAVQSSFTKFTPIISKTTQTLKPALTYVGYTQLPESEYYGMRVSAPATYEVETVSPISPVKTSFTPQVLVPKQTVSPITSISQPTKTSQISSQPQVSEIKPLEIQKTPAKTAVVPAVSTVSAVQQIQPQITPIKPKEEVKTIPIQTLTTPISITPRISPSPESPSPFSIGIPTPFYLESKKKKIVSVQQPYDAYAYIDSTKENKAYWKKINKKPLTKESALNVSAEYVDNTISAKGKIVKSKSTKTPINLKGNYFERNKYKFRDFKQKKGSRTKTPNQFIERAKYRLDSPSEVRKIQKERNVGRFFGI